MAKNLLVDWMNANNTKRANFLANIQSNMANKTSATNPNTVTTPNTPTITRPAISRPATINLQKAQQPVQTRLDNLNNQTLPVTQPGTITGNNPAFVNGKLRPSSTNEVMNAAQSRFIGFQQQQPTYPNTTIGTGQEGKSFEKLYNGGYMRIESNAEKAEKYNKKEEEKFRTTSEALMDFQGDVLKNNGKMTDWQLENRYPEFSDNLDSLKELQNELRPIVQSGMGVDPEQLAEYYPELLKPKKTYSIEAIKKNAAETEKAYENAKKIMDKALTLNVEGLSSNGLKVARDYDTLFNIVDVVKKKHSLGDANNSEILGYLLKNNDKVRELWDEIEASKANLTKTDKAILNRKDASLLDRVITEGTTGIIDLAGKGLEKLGLEGNRKATDEEIETAIRAKEKLESDFANQTWKKLAVEINVPLDSLEKFAYRTYKDVQNKILEKGSEYTKEKITKTIKSAFKKELGVDLTDEQVESIRNLYDTAVTPSINQEIQTNQQNVMDYLESVNKEYQSKRGTLDEDIENYTNNGSMTKMLLNRDLRGFGYKSSGEAAQNAEMPLMVLAGTVAPEIVLPLMTMDSYARESQESFEELMEVQQKNGISVQDAYENAQEGAAIVGIASAAVEVGLEKILGGVETTASKAFHDLLIKDVAEKTTKMVAERGLAEMLKQGLVTQFRSSFEEGMEEILQQAIHNKALQKYDPDQKLTEGLLQSFEGGFFNWMNLLGGGGDILSNIQQNKTNIVQNANQTAYNLGERARNVVDNLNQGAYNAGASTRNILDNVRNRVTTQNTQENQTNTSITPVNNNIQATNEVIEAKDDNTTTEKKNTAIKEGGLGEKVLESLNGLDENTRERIKKNPYSVEESKNLIKEMDENPGIDFGDYQNGRYEDVLNTILNKLEQKEDKRRNDIGSLYDKLEESNIDVDVTELKNKVAEFEAQAEALGDIITPAEQGQIKTILKNIQEIGDGTMDVWKVRRIADKRTKGSASSSYDGIGLIREIRDTIDSVIREQNPDMKEVDKAYRKVLNEISEIKGKLFYKKGGQVKSNAVSTVKNMLNAGNRLDLNNLEKYLPGIKDQLEAIRDSKFVYNAYTTGRGSRFISGIARGVFGNIGKAIGFFAGGWGGLLGGAVIDAGIDKAMVNLTRKALRDTITKETEASKAELERISKKIEEGKKLDAEDKARLKELGEKIMKNGEQMAKTKAEKEAWNKYMEEINDNITPQTTEEEQEKNKVTKKKATKKNKVTSKKTEATTKQEENKTTPITKDSEGNTLSKEDQEKFGNSKIVDKDGNLLVVMHGSANQETHDYYDETKAGSNVHADSKGVYFTDNLDLAEQFAHEQLPGSSAFRTVLGKRGHLYKSYVNITNPLNLNTATPEQLLPFFREDVLTKTWDEEKRLDNLKGHPQFVKFHVDMDKVEKAGYDGIIAAIGKEGEGNEYIVFKGNQAKNIGEIEAPKTEAKKEQPKNKATKKTSKKTTKKSEAKNKVTTKQQAEVKQDNDILNEETPQIAEEDTTRDIANDLEQNTTPQTTEDEQVKNKVTRKRAKATMPKVENKIEEVKVKAKPEDNSDLRSKIGDKFYEYMQKQVELTNNTRKGKNGLTGKPLNLKEVTMEELLPQYIDQFEKIAQQEVQEIQDELAEVTKDLPKAPKLTESQKTQLSKATSQEERNKLLRKWQDEWLKKNPISDEKVEQIRKLMDRAAEVVEGHKKARNYLYELEVEEENKENEDHFSYDTYGDIMKRVEDAENKINEEFDKKFEEEYDSKKKRFDELNEDDNTDRSDGSEIAKLANDLNNMRNKYDRLKEEAFNKRYPDLVEEKKRQEELFDKDWKKTYRRAIWNMENNNSKTKITDTAKNKVTNITVTKGGNITPDNSGITGRFRNLTAEEYNDMKEMGGLEKLYQQGKTDTIFRMQDLKEVVNAMIDLTVYGLPEDFNIDYHDFTTQSNGQSIVEIQQILDKLEAGEDTKEFEDVYGDHMVEKKDGTYEWDVEELKRLQRDYIGNMLDWAYERAYGEGKEVDRKLVDQIQGDLEGVKMDSYDIKETEKMIDKMKELVKKYGEYWHQGNSNDQWDTFVRYATDIDNLDNNETAQIPTIFEEDLEQMNLRELEENETPQANEEEMNKVTKKQPEKPKNLVTSKIEESDNTDSKAEQIFNTSMEQLKGAKKTSLGALGKVKQTEVKLDNGTTITYIDSSVGKGISQNAIIRINSPEAGYKTYVVTKIPNNPAEIREGGNVLTDEQVDKVYDILQGKNGEVKVEDMKVDVENVEDKKDPINAFLDNNEAIKNDPKLKYKYLSRLNDQTSWIDYSTDIRYNGTVAEKVQQTIDSFGKLSNGTRLPIKFSKNNYGNYIEVGDWETGAASRNIGDDIEFEYAKFLYDNPEIRSTKEIKADGLKEAIKKGNEIHKEVVKDAEEQKDGTPLDPEKYIRQQPTADEGIEAVYNETKKISDYFEARKESEKAGNPYGYGTEYREKVKAAQDALWRKLKFKSDRSKLYQDFVKNIRESNGNEKQLRSIAKNLYIQKVKDDFKNNYNYPAEVTDKVPGLRTAKDNYERYLKGRDTSFSGKDPRIDYSDKDRIGAGIKRQDGNQVTAAQRREIVNGVLEYAKYMGIDMKKMSEDAGVTYVHLNGKHPFLTKSAVGLFHGLFKSISVGADKESYSEKGKGRDAKLETHTVPVVMAHEITHAIDSMFERSLFSDQKTREMGRKMNDGRGLGDYWWRKAEITARMVEEYVDVMKGGEGYYNMRGYWNKDVFDNEIKPYVEQIFDEKFNGYKLTAKERNDIKLDEAPTSKNTVTASDLNKVTNR